MPPVIEARGLVKRYGDFTALAGVDFQVQEGECFGLLGANGAGKTSILKMISCVSPLTEGALYVGGRSVREEPRAIKARLGVVPEQSNLDEDLDVLENLLVYARYFDIPKRERRQRALEVLAFMELEQRARARIDTLSGGMKRRLLIARALLNRPKVLLLDEPTTGLDPHARHLVWERLHRLKAEGVTMVLSTHYMEEAAHLCDRLAVIDQGRVLASGTPAEIVAAHAPGNVVEVRLSPWDKQPFIERLGPAGVRYLDAGDALVLFNMDGRGDDLGVPQERLVRRSGNLEDVFLLLAGKGLDFP